MKELEELIKINFNRNFIIMLDWLKNINKEHPEFWKIMSLNNCIKKRLWFYR
jgi:hypothetical protein